MVLGPFTQGERAPKPKGVRKSWCSSWEDVIKGQRRLQASLSSHATILQWDKHTAQSSADNYLSLSLCLAVLNHHFWPTLAFFFNPCLLPEVCSFGMKLLSLTYEIRPRQRDL